MRSGEQISNWTEEANIAEMPILPNTILSQKSTPSKSQQDLKKWIKLYVGKMYVEKQMN